MGKWIRETDCEGKKVTYKCDACGFPDGWHDYKLCPMCGDPKEIESEDDDGKVVAHVSYNGRVWENRNSNVEITL